MKPTDTFNIFCNKKTWQEKVLSGDALWQQVKGILTKNGNTLPETLRRPDVRLICENLTGAEVRFKNPGDHSGSKEELIPATGDKAVMVMIKGETLAEQYKNAQTLFDQYDLGNQGLSPAFVQDMGSGTLSALVDEAYGPAPFEAQAGKLDTVLWLMDNGATENITPIKGKAAAFGARPPTNELVFMAQFPVFIHGTGTTAELMESEGMAIAVSADWKTGIEKTRPIVASVAKVYYGAHYQDIPIAMIDENGTIAEVRIPKKNPTQTIKNKFAPK